MLVFAILFGVIVVSAIIDVIAVEFFGWPQYRAAAMVLGGTAGYLLGTLAEHGVIG